MCLGETTKKSRDGLINYVFQEFILGLKRLPSMFWNEKQGLFTYYKEVGSHSTHQLHASSQQYLPFHSTFYTSEDGQISLPRMLRWSLFHLPHLRNKFTVANLLTSISLRYGRKSLWSPGEPSISTRAVSQLKVEPGYRSDEAAATPLCNLLVCFAKIEIDWNWLKVKFRPWGLHAGLVFIVHLQVSCKSCWLVLEWLGQQSGATVYHFSTNHISMSKIDT